MPTKFLPYAEPSAVQLLTVGSFLYLLNVSRHIFDRLIYAGLIGEIALGVVYGTPLAGILEETWEETFTILGYMGLVLIVFKGGLDIPTSLLVQNLPLSTVCALTGICLPIGLSMFLLHRGFGYPLVQAFTAGAALSSTSLGTTFFVLQSQGSNTRAAARDREGDDENGSESERQRQRQGMGVGEGKSWSQTRIGTILLSAALMDDIVGLVLLSVVTSLGQTTADGGGGLGWGVGRPLLASSALVVVVPPLWSYTVKPVWERMLPFLARFSRERVEQLFLLFVVVVLSGLVAAAYFAGSSMLLGAFLAGVVLKMLPDPPSSRSLPEVYRSYLGEVNEYLLTPLFFASIGFAIPFLELWQGKIVWRGICYSLLMILGKLLVGVWILFWRPLTAALSKFCGAAYKRLVFRRRRRLQQTTTNITEMHTTHVTTSPKPPGTTARQTNEGVADDAAHPAPSRRAGTLPAALLLGLALVARGEIGILIAQVAHSTSAGQGNDAILPDEPFLLAIWATVLCTVVGPVAVGWVARRYRVVIFESEWG